MIHLCLLLPWILLILVSILGIFGATLYVLVNSPHRKEIQECKREIIECQKAIKTTEQNLEKAKQGDLSNPPKQNVVQPPMVGDKTRDVDTPSIDDRQTTIPPIPGDFTRPMPADHENQSEQKDIAKRPLIQLEGLNSREIDKELVRELENRLDELRFRQSLLEDELATLKAKQISAKIPVWVNIGPLWLYFFYLVLPLVSWVMAMIEIIGVMKDGTGRNLGF